jgi:hypothetical protein
VIDALSHQPSIIVIAVIALGFILLGIFHAIIAYHFGMEEGTPGQRFLSLVIGLALFALLLVYGLAQKSMLQT